MTASRDPNDLIHRFLLEGEEELQDRVYDAVRAEVEQKRQRAVFGPWRIPEMNKFLAMGLGAAAVVVAVLVGAQLLRSPDNVGGPGEPSISPSVEPTPDPTAQAGVEPGAHVIWEDAPGIGSITVTLPNGWDVHAADHYLAATDFNNVGIIVFVGDLWVYEDPCQWSTTLPDEPATTVNELIDALGSQAMRNASDPADIGFENDESQRYVGESITLHVPDDAVFSDCDENTFGTLTEPGFDAPTRTSQEPGQIDEFLIVDVDGVPVTFDLTYFDETPPGVIDEMRAIVESAVYGN